MRVPSPGRASYRRPKHRLEVDIVISTDRCMVSHHHGHIFLGFLATSPPVGVPEKLWRWLSCPRPPVDDYGRPRFAPYGLRKIEASLQEAGFKAYVVDPDYVAYYLNHGARALFIGHHDYFAFGPPSSEWWLITGREPLNRRSFIRFISDPAIWEAKRRHGVWIVAGGPAVWQWEAWPEARKRWPVDTLVEGEADKVVVELAEKIMSGDPLPEKVVVPPGESPRIEEIAEIKAPASGGLVEIMRGCPRGCKFCSVTLRPLRFMPLDRIDREVLVNLEGGSGTITLHSEDVLLYGADGVRPRAEPLLRLHETVARRLEEYEAGFSWSHVSLAAVKYAEEHGRIVSRIADIILDGDRRRFIGVEVGLETGSVRLARRIMPAKAAPYRVEDWPSIVEDAFSIMAENSIFPVATFILGLPGEEEEDVYATIELIDRLRSYPSLIVPMFFVPMGALRDAEAFRREHLKRYHVEAMVAAARHSIRWARWIIGHGYLSGIAGTPLRILLNTVASYIEHRLEKAYREALATLPV